MSYHRFIVHYTILLIVLSSCCLIGLGAVVDRSLLVSSKLKAHFNVHVPASTNVDPCFKISSIIWTDVLVDKNELLYQLNISLV